MNTHADKKQENKSQSVANAVSQKQSSAESTFQFVDNRPEGIAQRKLQEMVNNRPQAKRAAQLQAMADNYSVKQQQLIHKKENNTGLPDNLKSGIENLSGYSMDDVKVHYNSERPAQLQAHAYAQGTDIHLASGQEKYLPHEAWHVVQQKQGRVKPTMQMKGKANINDDTGLEKEADVMGQKALHVNTSSSLGALSAFTIQKRSLNGSDNPIQMVNEYAHIVIDKMDVGLDTLRRSLNENGLQTAENRNIQLSEGSMKLKHHQHVFMWDGSKKGIEGAAAIGGAGGTVKIKIRMNSLSEPKWYGGGNLKGDGMGPLGGKSSNGAWAYEGNIDRKFLFIEGLDQVNQPGFQDWFDGKGWPVGHEKIVYKTTEYKESIGKLD